MPLPQDDPKQRQPDISLARATLGWQPKVPLAEGLRLQREYFLELSQTDDHREAVRAFREKRPPEFRNR